MSSTADRMAELEHALADANRQLLERDDELIRLARDKELVQARKTLQTFELQLKEYERDIDELNRAIAEMQETRAWRFAIGVRNLKGRLVRLGRRP